jgi:mono/diheme cytochrome c family protein
MNRKPLLFVTAFFAFSLAEAQMPAVHPGKAIYNQYCLACHQEDGSGVPSMNPPVRKSDWVSGDKTRLIKVIINGLDEEIVVNGESYQNAMAPHDFLSDQQIADLLSYLRSHLGNQADAVSPQEVAVQRKQSKK